MKELIPFSEVSARLGDMNRGNMSRLIKRLGLKTYRIRSESHHNQIIKCLDTDGWDILNKYWYPILEEK